MHRFNAQFGGAPSQSQASEAYIERYQKKHGTDPWLSGEDRSVLFQLETEMGLERLTRVLDTYFSMKGTGQLEFFQTSGHPVSLLKRHMQSVLAEMTRREKISQSKKNTPRAAFLCPIYCSVCTKEFTISLPLGESPDEKWTCESCQKPLEQ